MKKLFSLLLPTALLVAGAMCPATAQTARIARLSHSGSVETLAADEDNFGIAPQPYFSADSVRLISDTTALEYGNWYRVGEEQKKVKTNMVRLAAPTAKESQLITKRELINSYQGREPQVKLIGFDSTKTPSQPVLKQQKTKRKKSAFAPTTMDTPQHPGVGLAVALILGLSGAGWLLGERRPRPQVA